MTALERLRALRVSEKYPTEALTELTKVPSVSLVSGHVGGISKNTPTDPASRVASNPRAAPLNGPRWLAIVAEHLDTTPVALLAAGVILSEEVAQYTDRDPATVADTLRRAHPGRFPESASDDRRHCRTCQHLIGRCLARRLFVLDDLPRRCLDYLPGSDDPDQRPGRHRWPSLLKPLEGIQ